MAVSREPLRVGYDVDESAIRFSNYLHVLRELVHLSCGHLALEPRFEVKSLLADHLHDDARAVTKLQRRLDELRGPSDHPGAPADELAALLGRANGTDTHEYLEIAYGELKPTLIAAIAIHLAALDPLIDEPSLRLLTQLLHRQERHVAELPAGREHAVFDDLGALPLRRHEVRALEVMPPLDRPQRDDFVEITESGDPEAPELGRAVHGLMDAALCAAELTARNAHEHPDMPWEFHVDMARQCWDEVRHAEIHDRLMATELDCHWGDYPIGFGFFRSIYTHDLVGRLALSDAARERRQADRRGVLSEQRLLDYLLADELPHSRNGVRWGSHLLGGDEQAYRDKVRELGEALDRTGSPVAHS
jgi:hypothetical protein